MKAHHREPPRARGRMRCALAGDRLRPAPAGLRASMRVNGDPCNHAGVARAGACDARLRVRLIADGERHVPPLRTCHVTPARGTMHERLREPRHPVFTHSTHAIFQRKPPARRAAAERHPPDPPWRGHPRRVRGHVARVDGYPAGARLCAHRRHAGRHGPLHGVPAARRVRVLRRVAASGGGRRFRDRDDLREPAVVDGAGRQRRVCGAGRHGQRC